MDVKSSAALPAVPPPPVGERVQPSARGLATLIAGLDTAVIDHRSPSLAALVVVIEGRVTDAIAETPKGVIKGVEVLDELIDVEVNALNIFHVSPRLARVLPAYWRAPGATQEVIESFIQPGRRGAIAVTAPSGTGVLLFDEEGVVAAYRDGEQKSGSEALDNLLSDPDVVISARSDAMPDSGSSHLGNSSQAPQQNSQPAATANSEAPPSPPPAPKANPAPPAEKASASSAELGPRREKILKMLKSRLQRLSGPVEEPFNAAQSIDDLIAAAEQVRTMKIRMINPLTLQGIAEEATAIAKGEWSPQ